jgi:hypothetical protein
VASNEVTLDVVIGGSTTPLTFQSNQPLHAVIAEALGKTHNTGRPPSEWVPTNAAGDALDARKTLSALGLVSGSRLFLSLGAGVGGSSRSGPGHWRRA